MKRKTAKEILAESFRELAEKKKVDKITVRDIAENCGYSTTTFYRHFKDKYDLIVWEHTQYVSEIMDRVGGGDSFASGLIYGLMTTGDPELAVNYGAAHGALAMTTPGDTTMADRAEVEAVMNGAGARVKR